MPTLLQVGIWNVNCGVGGQSPLLALKNITGQLGTPDRCRLLGDVVARAIATMSNPPLGTPYLRLFLAPEYLFARSYEKHVMSYESRTPVLADLRALSALHSDVLFFPGTIAYGKAVVSEKKDRRAKFAHVTAGKALPPDQMIVSHNTAYAFHDGEQVFKYRKIRDAGEVGANENPEGRLVFAGGTAPGHFTFAAPQLMGGSLQIGVEVCVDHDSGYLSRASRNLDVHLILSASVSFKPAHAAVRTGGIVCHADTDIAPIVYQNVGGTMTALGGAGAGPSFAHPLSQMDASQNPQLAGKIDAIRKGYTAKATEKYKDLPGASSRPGVDSPRKTAILNATTDYVRIGSGKLGVFEAMI